MPNVGNDIKAVQAYYAELDKCVSTQTAWNRTMLEASPAAQEIIANSNGMKIGIEELIQKLRSTTVSAKAASLGVKALSMAGNMLISMGISMAIQTIISVIDNLAHASEHAKEALDDFHQKVKEGRDKLKEKYEFINSDETKKFDELSEGVDKFGNNISLTSDQFSEYHSIANKVADMFPDMVQGWDNQNNAILKNVDTLKKLNDEYEKSQDNFYNDIMISSGTTASEYRDFSNGNGFSNGNMSKILAFEKYVRNGYRAPYHNTPWDYAFYQAYETDEGNELVGSDAIIVTDTLIKELGLNPEEVRNDPNKQEVVRTYIERLYQEQSSRFSSIIDLITANAYFKKKNFKGAKYENDASQLIDLFINSMNFDNSGDYTYDELLTMLNQFIDNLTNNPNYSSNLMSLLNDGESTMSLADYEGYMLTFIKELSGENEFIENRLLDMFGYKGGRQDTIKQLVADWKKYENVTDEEIEKFKEEFKKEFTSREIDLMLNPNSTITVAGKTFEQIHKQLEKELNKEPITLQTQFDDLDDTGFLNGMGVLKKAMDELEDKGAIDLSTIYNPSKTKSKQGIMQLLGDYISHDEMEQYTKDISDVTKSVEDRRKALVELSQAYITGLIANDKFKTADENMLATALNEAGVMNSLAIAHEMVTQAKIRAAIASYENGQKAEEEVTALINEAGSAEVTKNALLDLELAKYSLGNVKLNTAEDVDKLIELAKQAGATTEQLWNLQLAKNVISSPIAKGFFNIKGIIGDLRKNLYKVSNIDYKPSDKKNTAAKQVRDAQKSIDDLEKSEALQKLKYKFDDFEHSITKVTDALAILDSVMSLQADDDYVGKLATVTMQIDLAQQKTSLLRDEFEQLNAETPVSADMAQELANRMKSVADNIASNAKNMRDYGKNVAEYYMSALKSVGSTQKATLDNATSLFERNVKTLSEGGLMGLDFSLTPNVPESSYDKQRKENQSLEEEMKRYYEAVEAMQKQSLDMQYQEQMADNERKRQDLNESLQDALDKQRQFFATGENDQINHDNKTKAEQEKTDNEIRAEQEATDVEITEEQKRTLENLWNGLTSFFSDTRTEAENVTTDVINFFERMYEAMGKAPQADKGGWSNYFKSIQESLTDTMAANVLGTSVTGTDKSSMGDSSIISSVVETAKKQLGTPYKWGGTTTAGFDCSGLIQYAYNQHGIGLSRTTYSQAKEGKFVERKELQPGDLVFFGRGNAPDHVGLYIGKEGNMENAFIHAPHTGDVVKYASLDSDYYKSHYKGARRILYAKGTDTFPVYGKNPNGIVAENYRDETIISKKTGKSSIVNSPALIDTNEYDIVGEKQTAEILKNQYATGTPTNDAKIREYIAKASKETGVPANIIMAVMDQETGYKWYDSVADGKGHSYGYMMLYDYGALAGMDAKRKQLAKTDRYTNVLEGAKLLASNYQRYGNWQTAIKRYNGSGSAADKYGRTVWNRANKPEFIQAAKELGSITSFASDIADNTSVIKELRKDFKTQLKDFLAGGQISTEESNGYEDDLLGYIKENVQVASKNNEKFIETYDALVAFQDKNASAFRTLDHRLQQSVGTDDYARIREEIHNTTEAYTAEMLGMQAKLNVERTKQTYGDNQKALAAARKYYNERRANGANADELSVIVKGIDEILNEGRELSDQYVSEMKALTEFLVTRAERVTKPYNDQLTWVQKTNEEFERELNYAEDISDRHAIISKQVKNYNQQLDINRKKQEAAHQAVLDLYDNEDYAPIFERYDIESWFDANGDFSAQFTKDLESMSMVMPELVPVMQQIAEQIQTQKKAWYEAGEAIDDVNDKLRDIDKQEADEKIDFYIKGRERVKEATEFDKAINDAMTESQQSFYDFKDGLREAQNEIDAQLEANKHLDQWLDPDTRKQLFNEQDYAEESLEIARLLEASDAARADYQEQISNLREDEQYKLEGITAEYNRQMEALKGQLDIAKQRLQTAKDLDAIENARKERDTQIIMGTRSQNVADPDKLYDLEMTAQKSRLELTNLETKQTEADDIRARQAISSQMGDIIESIGYVVDAINNLTPEGKRLFAGQLPETEELKGLYYSILRDSPWTIFNNDLTEEGYLRLDMDKRIGYDETVDHSQNAEDIAQMIADGRLPNTPFYRMLAYGNMQNHDNKNLTSPYHNGYAYYGNGELLGTDAKTLETHPYSYMDKIAEELEVEKKQLEALQAIAANTHSIELGGTVFSGEGEAVVYNPTSYKLGDTTITGDAVVSDGSGQLDDRTILTLEDGSAVDITGYKMMTIDDLYHAMGVDIFDRNTLAVSMADYTRNFEMQKLLGDFVSPLLKSSGVTDNSVHIDNVNLTESRPDMNSILVDVAGMMNRLNGITDNTR